MTDSVFLERYLKENFVDSSSGLKNLIFSTFEFITKNHGSGEIIMKKSRYLKNGFLLSIVALMVAGVSSNPVAAEAEFTLEEVVVTAQKREQSIQDVPASILAFGEDALREGNVKDFSDVMNITPGAAFIQFSPNQSIITIRGAGSGIDSAAGDASTAVHMDGIYLSRDGSRTFNLYDIERVEVLRGPQGTLYGKNALAGVVNFISNKPHNEKEISAEFSLGDYDYTEFKGMLNTPVSDKLSLRLAGIYSKRDGYFENLASGNDLGNVDHQALRLSTSYRAENGFDILLVADYSRDDTYGTARKLRPEYGADFLASPLGLGIPNTTNDIYKVELNSDGFFERDNYGIVLQVDKALGDGSLTWLSGYRSLDYDTGYDMDASLRNYREQFIDEESSQFSSELRYVSAAAINQGDLEYTGGLYYLFVDTDRLESQLSWSGMTLQDLLSNSFVPAIPQDSLNPHHEINETTSWAAYVDLKYKLTEALTFNLGGRYSYEKKDFSVDAMCGFGGVPYSEINGGPGNSNTCPALVHLNANQESIFSAETDESWSKFTFRTGLEYELNDQSMAYLNYAQGFKSGGYSPGAANAQVAVQPFDEELADSFELGYKTTFWENRARLNVALFYTEYSDLQVGLLDPNSGALVIVNAADAESQGFELDFVVRPLEALTIEASYAYNDSEYIDFGDNTGNELFGPKDSGSIAATYDVFLSSSVLSMHVDYNYKSDYFETVSADPRSETPSRGIVNLRLSYKPASEKWFVALWGKNVTDEEEILQIIAVPVTIGSNSAPAVYGPPATYGLTVGFDF